MITEPKLNKKVIFSCFLASTLEIYDFAIFGFFAGVLHKNYLSFLDTATALIVAYAFFSIGSVFRPLGSLIFGYIGDSYGRKTSLVTSVTIMGSASLLMFMLPPFATIGVWSCYIIVLVRILQGISVGGEFTGAIVFAVEHSTANRAGLITGIISAGGACGILMANCVSSLLQDPSLPEYSWRLAFLIGFILSAVGFFIRRRITDTPIFQKPKQDKIPLLVGLKTSKLECFATMCIAAANGVTFYFGSVYLGKFIELTHPGQSFNYLPMLVSIIVAMLLPIVGSITDSYDRKTFLLWAAPVMGLYSLFAINILASTESILLIKVIVSLYAIIAAVMIAPVNILAIEMFAPAYRMSCSGLFYSLGMGLIGGTVPMVASLVSKYLGDPFYIGLYISIVCFLAAISIWAVAKKHRTAQYLQAQAIENSSNSGLDSSSSQSQGLVQ